MAPSTVSQQPVLAMMDTRIFTFVTAMPKVEKPQRNLAVNDIVLLLDEDTPRSSWPLGPVISNLLKSTAIVGMD